MRRQVFALIVALGAAAAVVGCGENLDASKGCPLLCPNESVGVQDITLDAIAFDTTVTGLPPIGSEDYLLLASHGDSLDTRAIVRYDTLVQTFSHGGLDSAINRIDSAYIRVIQVRDTLHKPAAPVTVELYDVYTAATDTVASVLLPLFSPDRRIGETTFAAETLAVKDTLQLVISNAVVLDRISRGTPLRVGIRLVSTKSSELRLQSTLTGSGPTLSYRVSPDTVVARFNITPVSHTPADAPFLTSSLGDYMIVAKGNTATPSNLLSVGGMPVRRSYMRFDISAAIIDSSTIVRATLLLNQRPTPLGVRRSDSINVFPVAIVAQSSVKDVISSLQFSTALGTLGLTATRRAPADSGLTKIEVVYLLKAWKSQSSEVVPRVLALQSADENQTPGEINFFSSHAAASLRPRLRITYVPRASYGVP